MSRGAHATGVGCGRPTAERVLVGGDGLEPPTSTV
jgi:hypothetical protein